jgi:hypothetical protein
VTLPLRRPLRRRIGRVQRIARGLINRDDAIARISIVIVLCLNLPLAESLPASVGFRKFVRSHLSLQAPL